MEERRVTRSKSLRNSLIKKQFNNNEKSDELSSTSISATQLPSSPSLQSMTFNSNQTDNNNTESQSSSSSSNQHVRTRQSTRRLSLSTNKMSELNNEASTTDLTIPQSGNTSLIKTRSHNRLHTTSFSETTTDSNPINSSLQPITTPIASVTMNTKKRHLSNTDFTSINDPINDDSNSNSSLTSTTNTRSNQQQSTVTKKSKLSSVTTLPPIPIPPSPPSQLPSKATTKPISSSTTSHSKARYFITDENRQTTISQTEQICPLQIFCESKGHINGKCETHSNLEECPYYIGMNRNECVERRKQLDKNLNELNKKLTQISNELTKKTLRTTTTSASFNSSQSLNNIESSDYYKKIQKQRQEIVKLINTMDKKNETHDNDELNNNNISLNNDNSIDDESLIIKLKENITNNKSINDTFQTLDINMTNIINNNENNNDQINNDKNNNSQIKANTKFNIDDLNIPKFDYELFKDALVLSSESDTNNKINSINEKSNCEYKNKLIQFGNYEIETWYKSPYPDDYWKLNKIYICEFCLKYMKTNGVLSRHLDKCIWKHPPGREIYRKDNLSFFEVDGKYNKIYCQNLCLLAKLFLDHKTLYFDVEPFLFYVLTLYNQTNGTFNMIGYFSKEKQSIMNFNLSCILILPQYMNKGYGKLLIDFSYLLSKIEEKIGSPERPLSDLGLISYRNYWKATLLNYLSEYINNEEISIKDMSHDTGIHPNDIISSFQYIGLIKYWKGKHVLLKDKDLINKYVQKHNKNLQVDEAYLKWTPYINKIETTLLQNANSSTATTTTHQQNNQKSSTSHHA